MKTATEAILIPTLAEQATTHALQMVEIYSHQMKNLESNPPDRYEYVERIRGLRDDLRANLKAIFDNFEPALQAHNTHLQAQLVEHLRTCYRPHIIIAKEAIDNG